MPQVLLKRLLISSRYSLCMKAMSTSVNMMKPVFKYKLKCCFFALTGIEIKEGNMSVG